jgi:hypothetical protein
MTMPDSGYAMANAFKTPVFFLGIELPTPVI